MNMVIGGQTRLAIQVYNYLDFYHVLFSHFLMSVLESNPPLFFFTKKLQ
jgi:hypothetical protein